MTNATDESGMFTRTVKVNRAVTPLKAFRGLTRRQFIDETVVTEMPLGSDEEVTLHFFLVQKQMTCEQYAAELESRGLKPDPMAQAEYNEVDPDFSDKYSNCTQWQNQAGKFCCAFWSGWNSRREVSVREDDDGWYDVWFACGVRK